MKDALGRAVWKCEKLQAESAWKIDKMTAETEEAVSQTHIPKARETDDGIWDTGLLLNASSV